MKSESEMGSAGAKHDYSLTRPVEKILAKARAMVINIKDLAGPGQGYSMFAETIGTATPFLPDQKLISTWATTGLLYLMRPLVTPCEENRYRLIWGLRGVVTALAHHDIDQIPVLVIDEVTPAEMDELAFLDIYALPLEISLRSDASGVGRLFMAFSARTETVPKTLLRKIFPGITSLRRLESVTGIYVPSGKGRSTGQTPQTTREAEPEASGCGDEVPKVAKDQGNAGQAGEKSREPITCPTDLIQQALFFDGGQSASFDLEAGDGVRDE